MANASTIKQYLVGLGFDVNNHQLSQFNEALKKAARIAEDAMGGITKGFVLGGATITGVLTTIAGGTVALMNHIAQSDLDMQVFARRMFLSTDAARKMKTATDALGYSIEEIVWGPPELAERYHTLIADQNKMLSALGGADFERQMRNLRDVRFEFTRLGVEMKYFTMLVVSDLSKALFGDEDALLGKLRKFSDWFMANMPSIATKISNLVAPVLKDLGHILEDLWNVMKSIDWERVGNILAKSINLMLNLVDKLLSHPDLARTLLGAGAGAIGGGLIGGPLGAAVGAAAGGTSAYLMGKDPSGAFNNVKNWRTFIEQTARAYGVDPALALGVARQESGFNAAAVNPKSGAMGLFQLMPGTASQLGVDPSDPVQNVYGGIRYLKQLLTKHHGDVGAALKEYGGFVTQDPSDYIDHVQRYRQQYSDGLSAKPMSYHYTGGSVTVHVAQSNASVDDIKRAVAHGVEEANAKQNARLLAQLQGVYA